MSEIILKLHHEIFNYLNKVLYKMSHFTNIYLFAIYVLKNISDVNTDTQIEFFI